MTSRNIRALSLVVAFVAVGCGGSQPAADSPASGAGSASAPPAAPVGSASSASAPAGSAATPQPEERPFANNALEAQSMIQDQIDKRIKPLWKCVEAYRTRKNDPHKAVVVDIGIDQEGNLLGVTAANAKKGGDLEPALKDCMFGTLHGMPFPRSHAGVITVRQTFSDAVTQ